MGSMTLRGAVARCLAFPLALLILFGAGCGGEDGSPPPADDAAVEGRERPGAGGDDDGEAAGESGEASQRVLEACREVVRRAPALSEKTKGELIAECEQAASDDEEAARRAAGAACDAIAAATVPGPLRGPVADACRKAIPESTRL